MRLRAPIVIAAALLAWSPVAVSGVGPESRTGDERGGIADAMDDARVAIVQDGAGGTWTVRIDPPADGARDLVVRATHVETGGAQIERATRVPDAARWFPTIAPLDGSVRVDGEGVTVDVTRIGFREYPLARVTLAR